MLVCALALLSALGAWGQAYKIVVDPAIPQEAGAVLTQRFTQMLGAAGHAVTEEGTPITVTGQVTDRMETPGSMSQVALTITLYARAGEVVAQFPLKGVGADDADAWLRAVKQLLPKSKAAQAFTDRL